MFDLYTTRAIAIVVGATFCMSGCVTPPDQGLPPEPSRAMPETFGPAAGALTSAAEPDVAALAFEVYFDEPELASLVEAALEGNQELRLRVQDILLAEYEVLGRSGEYLPRVDATAGIGLEKVGEVTSQGVSDEALDVPKNLQDYTLGLAASWEVDIWKRLRNLTQAARAEYLASIEGRNFLVTNLVAEIASSYYELTALDRELSVLDRNIAIQQDALKIVQLEMQAARVTQLAVQRFEAEVLKNRSKRYELIQRTVEVENRINFLVGRFPRPIVRDAQQFDAGVKVPVGTGVPTAMLENRPDVRQAELRLTAAKLNVEAARARFYPALSIEAGLGFEAFKSGHLFRTPESLFYGIAGGLIGPLINRRGIRAEFFSTIAEQWKATTEYEQTLLRAYIEVANQLALLGNLAQASDLQSQQVGLLEEAIDVSGLLFRSARADYMEVLLTRRDALDAELELIETRLRQKLARVQVYRALGGGWRRARRVDPRG